MSTCRVNLHLFSTLPPLKSVSRAHLRECSKGKQCGAESACGRWRARELKEYVALSSSRYRHHLLARGAWSAAEGGSSWGETMTGWEQKTRPNWTLDPSLRNANWTLDWHSPSECCFVVLLLLLCCCAVICCVLSVVYNLRVFVCIHICMCVCISDRRVFFVFAWFNGQPKPKL